MQRPKRKQPARMGAMNKSQTAFLAGYNKACDDWKEWLPTKDEVGTMLSCASDHFNMHPEEVQLIVSIMHKRLKS